MRLIEELPCRNGDGGEVEEQGQREVHISQNEWCPVVNGGFSLQKRVVVVGYALTSKKTKSFLQPKLEGLARNKGILFVAIDHNRPLSDQGPFDIVLHKLSGKEWRQILEDYRQTHPEVTVLDPPDAIQHLRNRQYMLQALLNNKIVILTGKVGVPRQLVIKKDASSIPELVVRAGLTLPLVAKPLVADGSAKSHELSLAYGHYSLEKLEPPLVLQEFVNHGGVLFKVYIVGDAIKVVRRFSLPDVCKWELSQDVGIYRFPRVSCAAASADDADLDPTVAELPPRPLLERLAKELRRRLGLRLFNMDIIRELGTRDVYYVIDINYFPGKMRTRVGIAPWPVYNNCKSNVLETLCRLREVTTKLLLLCDSLNLPIFTVHGPLLFFKVRCFKALLSPVVEKEHRRRRATDDASASEAEETRVQSGGNGGKGGYTVGFRFISHGWVFRGLVFMWCAVAFLFGLDEHSIANPPPLIPTLALPFLNSPAPPLPNDDNAGAGANLEPNIADTDIFPLLSLPALCYTRVCILYASPPLDSHPKTLSLVIFF
ncbi:inositol-tetrakisphosphate 1-kinase 3-like isoform X1 [Senna tora]|uniref:Inositol-tetrakisphosphate 1-kinase 3-like isoform X1 n=1 Tax=Senna tora TaxID=362788 RepID=A0A834SCI2_9FABA|nr:inositol-tetrakisphosphate 1-kinase 3-like isoform X1 [Senna tora]